MASGIRVSLVFLAFLGFSYGARNDDNLQTNTDQWGERTFNIDDDINENTIWEGSGYSNDDSYAYSGGGTYDDDEDWDTYEEMEGSGFEESQSPCRKLLEQMNSKNVLGAYIPRCTEQGQFDSVQCWGSTGECWCVDKEGIEIANTRRAMAEKPNCDNSNTRGMFESKTERPLMYPENNGDLFHERNSDVHHNNNDAPVEIITQNPSDTDPLHQDKTVVEKAYSSLTARPGILGGVIGGVVVGLLCAVLLVMFIVYRMRKKDEGSYSLDPPKRTPSLHTYSKASNREFYA